MLAGDSSVPAGTRSAVSPASPPTPVTAPQLARRVGRRRCGTAFWSMCPVWPGAVCVVEQPYVVEQPCVVALAGRCPVVLLPDRGLLVLVVAGVELPGDADHHDTALEQQPGLQA